MTDVTVTVRYWAAAKAAAGCASEAITLTDPEPTVEDVLDAAVDRHPGLRPVTALASVLLDGSSGDRERAVRDGTTLEVLPPFAGG